MLKGERKEFFPLSVQWQRSPKIPVLLTWITSFPGRELEREALTSEFLASWGVGAKIFWNQFLHGQVQTLKGPLPCYSALLCIPGPNL